MLLQSLRRHDVRISAFGLLVDILAGVTNTTVDVAGRPRLIGMYHGVFSKMSSLLH